MPYYNPYVVVVQQPMVYDYSQPISTIAPMPSQSVADPAISLFDQGRDAFRAGNYTSALSLTNQALRTLPNDPALHEFRSLALFAQGRFEDAAAPLYAVLSVGPGWDWPTMIGLYPDVDTYTRQLRALESYVTQNPRSAAARFVLAYHYLTAGHVEPAIGQLRRAVQLQPRDTLSSQLLQMLEKAGQPAQAAPAGAAQPAGPVLNGPEPVAGAPVAAAKVEGNLAGDWTAEPGQDMSIRLSFPEGNQFVWQVTRQGKTQEIRGDRTYGNGLLTLAQTGDQAQQPPMVGRVTWQDENHFTFKVIGGPPNDPGLNFTKAP
jgi:tetratricopeptide (TPR) repeat protein